MAMHHLPLPPDLAAIAAPPPTRAARTATTLLIGKLQLADGTQALCRARNLSATGMMIESHAVLTPGEAVEVELRARDRLAARVMWVEHPRAGLELQDPIDVATVLRPRAQTVPADRRDADRAPRFSVSIKGRVSGLGRAWAVTIDDISQSGARLMPASDVPVGVPITLAIAGLAPRACYVRWRDAEHVGVAFIEMISYAELSLWLMERARLN